MYAVIQRILAQLPAIKQVFADDKSHWPLPSWTSQNIAVLEVDQNGLIPVLEFTNILSAETYVTVSSLLPMKDILKEEESAVKTAEKKASWRNLTQNSADRTLQLMHKVTLLDPCYKGDHIEALHLDVSKSQREVEMMPYWKKKTN